MIHDGEDLDNVDWDKGGRVHNWRNHVPEEVADIWSTFTSKQKVALYNWANDMASREEWE